MTDILCSPLQSSRDGVWWPKAAGAPAAGQVAVRQAGCHRQQDGARSQLTRSFTYNA